MNDNRTDEQKHAERSNIFVGDRLDYTLDDYWNAPSGVGPLAATWADKPHRLLYDLIAEMDRR